MTTEKELFQYLALNYAIYLPADVLAQTIAVVKARVNAKESIFEVLYSLGNDKTLQQHKDPLKGKYEVYISRDASKRPVQQIDLKTGKVLNTFDSIYAATKAVGKKPDCAGNIFNAAAGKVKSAYGYKWKF